MKKLLLITALCMSIGAANASVSYNESTKTATINGVPTYPTVAKTMTYDSRAGVMTINYEYPKYDSYQHRYVQHRVTQQVNASLSDYKTFINIRNKPVTQKPVVQQPVTQTVQEDTTPYYTEPTTTYTPQQQTEPTVLDNALNATDTVLNVINLFK